MQLTCPRCLTRHQIDASAIARTRGPRTLKFRCSNCGHTFSVDPAPSAPRVAPEPPPLGADRVATTRGEPVQQVQIAGQIWPVPDVATLLRWILERRLDREALVADASLRWESAGNRTDFTLFFAAADALANQAPLGERTEVPASIPAVVRVETRAGPSAAAVAEADGSADPVTVAFDPETWDLWGHPTRSPDDTQEQTVQSMSVDEAPIPTMPAELTSGGQPEPEGRAEATNRLPDRTPDRPAARGLPSAADARFGLSGRTDAAVPAAAQAPGAPRIHTGPAPAAPRSFPGPSAGPSAGPVARHLAGPSAAPESAGEVDPFEAPPSGLTRARPNWALYLAVAAGFGLVAFGMVTFLGGPEGVGEPVAEAGAEAPEGAPAGEEAVAGAVPGVEEGTVETVGAGTGTPAEPAGLTEPVAEEPVVKEPVVKEPVAKEPTPVAKAPAAIGDPPTPVAKAPAPVAKASAAASAAKLLPQAWAAVDGGDFQKAHALFDRALQSGGGSDAVYGRGYANEKLGDSVSALEDYCRARRQGTSKDIEREIEGGLRRLGQTCP